MRQQLLAAGFSLSSLVGALCSLPTFCWATIYVVARSDNYITVAMDTRETTSLGGLFSWLLDTYSDKACKILPLGDRHVFFMTGTYSKTYEDLNTYKFAIDHYVHEPRPLSIAALTHHWAEDLATRATAFYYNNNYVFEKVFAKGEFGGTDFNNKLALYGGVVGLKSGIENKYDLNIYGYRPLPPHQVGYHLSSDTEVQTEIMQEVRFQSSPRAIDLFSRLKSEYKTTEVNDENADGEAFMVSAIASGIIQWSGRKNVGGEVATMIIERGQRIRWFRQPSFCWDVPR